MFNPLHGTGYQARVISCRFFPDGTSDAALTVQGGSGEVSGVARQAAAGVFLVTLTRAHKACHGAFATVQHTTAADLVAQIGDISNLGTSSATTVVVRVNAGATPTDITANANSSVSVLLYLEETLSGS